MTIKTKNILIILSLISVLVVEVLLIVKIGDVAKMGATITYDANGCPKDGNNWTYDIKTNMCTLYTSPTLECANGYKYSSSLGKCYKSATRVNNNYQCFNGDTKITNNKLLVTGTYCVRNRDIKTCKRTNYLPSNASVSMKIQVSVDIL